MSSTKKTAKIVKAKAMARSSTKEKVKTGLSGKAAKSDGEKAKLKAATKEKDKVVSKAKETAKPAAKTFTKPAAKPVIIKSATKPTVGKASAEAKVDKKSAATTAKTASVQVLKPVAGKKSMAPPQAQENKTTIVKKTQQAKDVLPPAKDATPEKSAAPVKPVAKAAPAKATEAKVDVKPAAKAATAKAASVKTEAPKPAAAKPAAPKVAAKADPVAETKPVVAPFAPARPVGGPVPPRPPGGMPSGRFGAARQPFPPIVKPVDPRAAANGGKAPGGVAKTGFKTHEYIVYPAHGVGQIIATEEQEVAGHKLELYVISFLKDKLTLKVPLPKVLSGAIRKLSDAATVQKSLDTLTGRARVKRTMWSRRAQEYEAKINSGDLVAIAEVVRDLYRSEAQPEQSYSERQLYEAALDRMAREVGVVQKLTETESFKVIEQHLEKGPRRGTRAEAAAEADADADSDGEIEAAA